LNTDVQPGASVRILAELRKPGHRLIGVSVEKLMMMRPRFVDGHEDVWLAERRSDMAACFLVGSLTV